MPNINKNACSWQWRKFQVIHCTCSKDIVKNIGNLIIRLLVISLFNIPLFFPQLYPFPEPEPPRFFTAPAPGPAPSKPFRRLRLRLRLRPKCVGSGGSGSGSGSASLDNTHFIWKYWPILDGRRWFTLPVSILCFYFICIIISFYICICNLFAIACVLTP